MDDIYEIEELEIGGYCGELDIWKPNNGVNSIIYTSVTGLNEQEYIKVGFIPENFGSNLIVFPLVRSAGKFIKIICNSHLGIGHIIINDNSEIQL